jgi:hypothetical protein
MLWNRVIATLSLPAQPSTPTVVSWPLACLLDSHIAKDSILVYAPLSKRSESSTHEVPKHIGLSRHAYLQPSPNGVCRLAAQPCHAFRVGKSWQTVSRYAYTCGTSRT